MRRYEVEKCSLSQQIYDIIICYLILGIVSLFLYLVLNSSVFAFDPNATKYVFVKKWGFKGTGDGQFHRIHDIDFNPSETRLYAIDRDGNRIQVFDKNGTFLFKWGSNGYWRWTIPRSI